MSRSHSVLKPAIAALLILLLSIVVQAGLFFALPRSLWHDGKFGFMALWFSLVGWWVHRRWGTKNVVRLAIVGYGLLVFSQEPMLWLGQAVAATLCLFLCHELLFVLLSRNATRPVRAFALLVILLAPVGALKLLGWDNARDAKRRNEEYALGWPPPVSLGVDQLRLVNADSVPVELPAGKAYVVSFYYNGCRGCWVSHQSLTAIQPLLGDSVVVAHINTGELDSYSRFRAGIQQRKMAPEQYFYRTAGELQIDTFPLTVVLDANRKPLWSFRMIPNRDPYRSQAAARIQAVLQGRTVGL